MALCAVAVAADKVTLTVTNSLGVSRANEVVEINVAILSALLDEADNFIITDADGNEIPSQQTYDGKIIFQAGVAANGKSIYYAKAGEPQDYEKQATGRLFTERGDEFGWENDRVAYRIYGHGAAVGYDLFNKSTPKLMLDYWYASEQNQEMRSVSKQLHDRGYHDLADQVYNAFCYHIDHGEGMDCYTVGPTLGGGANALVNPDGSLCLPKCYQKFEILENGPLRFSVLLTYPEIEYKGHKVVEQRVISLSAGSQFNKVTVTYKGLPSSADMASGVVVHKQNPSAYVLNKSVAYVGYEDLGDASVYNKKYADELSKKMGRIYVGTVYPGKIQDARFLEGVNGIAVGHALGYTTVRSAEPSVYYFGCGWSENPNTGLKSLADWEACLASFAKVVQSPLRVSAK